MAEVRLASGIAAGRVVGLAADPRREVVRADIPSNVERNPLPWIFGT